MVSSIDYTNLAEQTISLAKNIGVFLTKLFGALILSYIFIIDRKRITSFLAPLEKSNFAFLHREYSIIFRKINDNFGVIFKAQAIIALVNALLTSI
jgi:predicted PurR-regulated permease PerM